MKRTLLLAAALLAALLLGVCAQAETQKTVSSVALTGFSFPAAGESEAANRASLSAPTGALYHISDSAWYENGTDGKYYKMQNTTFVKGRDYYLKIWVFTDYPNAFTDHAGASVDGIYYNVERPGDERCMVVKIANIVPHDPYTIDSTRFPNVVFRNYVISHCDTNGNGILDYREAMTVDEMDLSDTSTNLVSLKGIEYFPRLTSLNVSGNKVNSLNGNFDLSNNTWLEELICDHNNLDSIDVSGLIYLKKLVCEANPLNTLDVTKNTRLTYLNCTNTVLSALDVTRNTQLETLYCALNRLTTIDLSRNTKLSRVKVEYNDLARLDISACPKLVDVVINGTSSILGSSTLIYSADDGSLYLPTDTELYYGEGVAVNNRNFPDYKFRRYVQQNIDTDGDNLLSDAEIEAVTELRLTSAGIGDMTGVGYFTALKKLYVGDNALTALDLSKNTLLEFVSCSNNQLTDLDTWRLTNLRMLFCYDNQITSLTLSNNKLLEQLDVDNNGIQTLDISYNGVLWQLYANGNGLRYLYFPSYSQLSEVSLTGNDIGVLNLTRCPILRQIVGDGERSDNTDGTVSYEGPADQQGHSIGYLYVDADTEVTGTGLVPLDAEHFPDAKLRTFLDDKDNDFDQNKDHMLSPREIGRTEELEICGLEIEDLTGIEVFTNLYYLNIEGNPVDGALDITPFEELTSLYMSETDITDVGYDPNAVKLETVSCANIGTDDLSWLRGLRDLKELDLSYSSAAPDLTVLDDLPDLKILRLNRCHLNDPEALGRHISHWLSELYIDDNPLNGALDLGHCDELDRLDAVNCGLTAVKLSGSGYLDVVRLHRNSLRQLWIPDCGARGAYLHGTLSGTDINTWSSGIDGYHCVSVDKSVMIVTDDPEDFEYIENVSYYPTDAETIGESAFEGTSVAVIWGKQNSNPNPHVKTIGKRAFADCEDLVLIEIPYDTTSIASDAFAGSDGVHIFGQFGSKAMWYAYDHGIPFIVDTPFL